MIQPLLEGESFLADVEIARRESDRLHLWWLGQSGFLLHAHGHCALIDPYLSDSLTRKYSASDKPHVRMTARVIEPAQLGFVELLTSSHQHTDHFDPETILGVMGTNPELQIVCPMATREAAAKRIHCEPSRIWGMNAGETLQLGYFELHAIPAAHEDVDLDPEGRHLYLGYVIRGEGWSIYHSGDTVLFPSLAERLAPFAVTAALLPINGRRPERRVAGNLWGREAAQLARDIDAQCAIPCHYEMFEFNTESPDEFVEACRRIGQPHRVLHCGERWGSNIPLVGKP